MKRFRTLTRGIGWAILAIMLSIDWAVTEVATAQNRRLQRSRVAMPAQQRRSADTDITKNLTQNMLEIVRSVSDQAENGTVDLAFVVDGSRRMANAIAEVERRLPDIANVFDEGMIDYQFARTSFGRLAGVPKITTHTFETDLVGIQTWLRELQVSRNAETGYGLDAILQTLREINFRPEAFKHLLVMTDSRLQTAWTVENARDKVVKEIVALCELDDIHINIIGMSESAQIQLSGRTGGQFRAISGKVEKRIKFVDQGALDKSILSIEGVFKLTAQHIAQTVRQPADIVFMFDSSLSMAAKTNKIKADRICGGIDEMENILNSAGVDCRFGVIRFWAAIGSGESVVTLSKPPLTTDQVKRLYRAPKQGDKNLLGAVVKGVPKIKTPADRKLVLVIVTDGSTTHRAEKGYTVNQAIGVCRKADAQVNVIGESSMGVHSYKGRFGGRATVPSIDFQKRVAATTNGVFYVMPGIDGRR